MSDVDEDKRCEECGGRFDRPGLFGCGEGHPDATKPQAIVAVIESDIRNRRGLRQEFEGIDAEIQDEIRDTWADLIEQELASWKQ